jgi:hypothetical protein
MILLHLMLCAKDIMREEIMGRHHLFLVAARTGCVM